MHEASTSLSNSILTLVSFIVLLVIVGKYAWKPIMQILSERENRIKTDLQTAALQKTESMQANDAAQTALREARAESNQIILNAKKQGLQLQDQMMQETKEEIERMKESATKEIAQERARIMTEMRMELADISVEIAEKILQREIKDEDHHRLVDDFIQGMDD